MSSYDKINNCLAPLKRKMVDYKITTQGRSMSVTRIGHAYDAWGNSDQSIISEDNIEAIVIFPPGDLPLTRSRGAGETAASTSLFFYDILPIEAYFKWGTHVEIGDVFYFSIQDDAGNKMPIMFRVLDSTGGVSTQLVRRKYICAPLTSLDEVTDPDIRAEIMAKVGLS